MRLAIDSLSVSAGNLVPRRVARLCGPWALVEGSTWNSARSWASVSLIKAVISWGPNSAVVKIRGGGNLDALIKAIWLE